jgi:hypothetical protein
MILDGELDLEIIKIQVNEAHPGSLGEVRGGSIEAVGLLQDSVAASVSFYVEDAGWQSKWRSEEGISNSACMVCSFDVEPEDQSVHIPLHFLRIRAWSQKK